MVKNDDSRDPAFHSHHHIHFSLVALLAVCAMAAALIFSGFRPHELYRASTPAPVAASAGTAGR